MIRFAILVLAVGVGLLGTEFVVAAPPPPYNFTVSPEAPVQGQTVTFTATGLRPSDVVSWDFENDGTVDATGPIATHAYAAAGQKTVRMVVTKNDGEVKEVLKVIRVGARPTASFTASPNPAIIGETVQFDAGASSDPDGTIVSYAWDLDGNGSFETSTGGTPTASKAYAAAGTVNVGLRVTDNDGATATTTVPVVVDNRRPVASFTAAPNPATVGESVTFNAAASSDPDGTIVSYAWDLDNDGQFDDATGVTTSRSFATAGAHTVRLSVTDNRGGTDAATVSVTVDTAAACPRPTGRRPPPSASSRPSRSPRTSSSSSRPLSTRRAPSPATPGTSTAMASSTTPPEGRRRGTSSTQASTG